MNKNKEILLDEKEYIENLLSTHNQQFISDKGFTKTDIITMLSIYYKNKDSTIDSLYKQIDNDMLKFGFKDYYSANFYKIIMSKCKYSLQKDLNLKELKYIPIYNNEMEIIKTCTDNNGKKLLFTIYVLARYNDFNGWTNNKIKLNDYSRLANIRCNCQNRNLLFYNLTKNCYIKQSFNISKFIYHVDLDKNDGNIVMKITNIKDLGNQLIAYLKDGYTTCSHCGKLIKIKSKYDSSTKYCDECARKMDKEKKLRWWNKNKDTTPKLN